MNTLICQYCNTEFLNLYNLNSHQKKAKYCLSIQGKINIEKNKVEFKCEYCNKNISSKYNLEKHIKICTQKKEKDRISEELKVKDKKIQEHEKVVIKLNVIIEQLEEQNINYKEQIKELQDKLDKIANKAIDRPTTTNNTTLLNISSHMDFNDIDKIKNTIENRLNINHVIDGQKGLANFVKDNLLTDDAGNLLYVCTDPSRHIFKYKDSSGEVKKDVEAKKLTNYILEGGIKRKTGSIGNEWCKNDNGDINMDRLNIMLDQQQSILKLSDDNNSFKKELAALTT